MNRPKISAFPRTASALLLAGCSLLQDPDSLSRDYGAPSGGSAGRAGTCEPTNADLFCDGLDQSCAETAVEPTCPSGCAGSVYGGSSYMGCSSGASFEEAELLCQKQRMHLVQIDTASENNFIVQIAQTLGSYVWIGGSDQELLATYAWVDHGPAFYANGAPIAGVYQHFAEGQPAPVTGFDCVQLHDDPDGPWSTARCSDVKQFICGR